MADEPVKKKGKKGKGGKKKMRNPVPPPAENLEGDQEDSVLRPPSAEERMRRHKDDTREDERDGELEK